MIGRTIRPDNHDGFLKIETVKGRLAAKSKIKSVIIKACCIGLIHTILRYG